MQTELFDPVDNAKRLLEQRFALGVKRAEGLTSAVGRDNLFDILVPHDRIWFEHTDKINLHFDDPLTGQVRFALHPHALGQICGKVKLPLSYVQYLNKYPTWGVRLVCENLNELFQLTPFQKQDDKPAQFLLRTVGSTVRGFVSRRYALHLSTTPLLGRFDEYAKEFGAKPIGADWSDVRLQLHTALPYVYTPFKEQNVLIGMSFFNSDFGAGTFSVSPSVLDIDRGFSMVLPQLSLGATMSADLFKKIHLGPMLQQRDLNNMNSDRAKRVDEVSVSMRNNMRQRLSPDFCDSVCRAIAKAQDTDTTWGTIRRSLATALLKEEIEQLEAKYKARDAKLPVLEVDEDGLPIITNWWASVAVAELAAQTLDPDRKIELQQAAGKFITTVEG
jgi:hypothetical protein